MRPATATSTTRCSPRPGSPTSRATATARRPTATSSSTSSSTPDVDAFAAALDLPPPARDLDALERLIVARHGEDGWARAVDALAAGTERDRYRRLYADPALALDVAWGWAGGVTRGALDALVLRELGADDAVLDLGCGEGLAGAYVAWRTGARVVGLDLREEAAGCAAVLSARLGVEIEVHTGTLLRPPAAIRRLRPALVLAFRVLHEVDPSKADRALAGLAGPAPVAVLERELPASEVLRRAQARAAAGLPVATARLVRSDGLDGRGWFPLTLHRRGAQGLDGAGLRRMWGPTLDDPSPWHGWTADLVLERAGATLHARGDDDEELWVARDRVFARADGLLHEHGREELPRLEAELR